MQRFDEDAVITGRSSKPQFFPSQDGEHNQGEYNNSQWNTNDESEHGSKVHATPPATIMQHVVSTSSTICPGIWNTDLSCDDVFQTVLGNLMRLPSQSLEERMYHFACLKFLANDRSYQEGVPHDKPYVQLIADCIRLCNPYYENAEVIAHDFVRGWCLSNVISSLPV